MNHIITVSNQWLELWKQSKFRAIFNYMKIRQSISSIEQKEKYIALANIIYYLMEHRIAYKIDINLYARIVYTTFGTDNIRLDVYKKEQIDSENPTVSKFKTTLVDWILDKHEIGMKMIEMCNLYGKKHHP